MTDIILPAQYSSAADRRLAEPHKRLMAAVLQAVVDDCRDGSVVHPSASAPGMVVAPGARNAIAYMASGDRAWPFSFENLCDALGLDADSLREQLNVKCFPFAG